MQMLGAAPSQKPAAEIDPWDEVPNSPDPFGIARTIEEQEDEDKYPF